MARHDEVGRLRSIIETQRLVGAATLDAVEVARVVTERAQLLTGADAAVVEMADGDWMVCRAACGLAAGQLGTRLPLAGGVWERSVRTGEALRYDDAETGRGADGVACRRMGGRSMVVVPIVDGGRTIGVLKVTSIEPAHFDDVDVQALGILASLAASSLARADDLDQRRRQAIHDDLTGLPNRALLVDRLEQALAKARRSPSGTAVFLIALDGLAAVRRTCGQDRGDDILRAVAGRLATRLRGGDTLARFGGDELVMVCEGADPVVETALPPRIEAAVGEVVKGVDAFSGVGARIGCAWTWAGERSGDELLTAADAAANAAAASMGRLASARR